MSRSYRWRFPLPRTHTGVLQGNGAMGIMVWGEGNVLRLTVGRSDLWDHRGGMPWREGMSYLAIRELLEAGDEQGLRALFEGTPPPPGQPRRPSVVPIGRVEVVLPAEQRLEHADLDVDTGRLTITTLTPSGEARVLTADLSMQAPLLCLEWPADMPAPEVRRVPAWRYVGDYLQSISFTPPAEFDASTQSGWVQELPADPDLCLAYRVDDNRLWLTAQTGQAPTHAFRLAEEAISAGVAGGAEGLRRANDEWWAEYWSRAPRLDLPSDVLSFHYRYGMYKFAGLTNPGSGIAATLQGPWIEEYQMPPWSSDYHFNINVQMCYWPAYRANLLHHLKPLWEMLKGWEPLLRQNARIFLGIDDGLMLPHAVDDRGTCMGGFWTGSVDHGCTAWVAHMMYYYWRYTGDLAFLRETAYPFMLGAMRVYEGMLEVRDGRFRLPVGVSPEFGGSGMHAWGANASFQLACIHWLCESLQQAAAALGEEPRPLWQRIREGLPLATTTGGDEPEIALWEGQPLSESHRHHSFIAGLHPFDVLPLDDPQWWPVIERSLGTWVREGMGLWSGWAMPWAAIIHSRVGNADMAELALTIWDRVFTNEGHGTLHDCQFSGFTLMGRGPAGAPPEHPEVMQMDAGMGTTAAIMELLLQTRRGVNYLFAGAPVHWRSVGFDGLRTEGGFVISARREDGIVTEVRVTGEFGGEMALANPWPSSEVLVDRDGATERCAGKVIAVRIAPGEAVVLRRA
ncbi:MAG: glycosyl hydrolase family 95 catalytic domain-containing protein [Anaerolineae bacterium]